ncbi:hypothetical protein [Streptococcus sp. E17BB]|uniref:hypothetical protein n=1 Tax=Streptococcus sp. E17BB TaxID=3278714 RepID=UPI00359E0561
MKKTSLSEIFYFILSLVLIGLFVLIYLFHHQKQAQTASSRPKTVQTSKAASKKVPKTDAALDEWIKRLEALEKTPKADLLEKLKEDYRTLENSEKKTALAQRLTELEAEITRISEAEEAVVLAETYGYQSYIAEARALVGTIKTVSKKEELQARLNVLYVPPVQSETIAETATVPIQPEPRTEAVIVPTQPVAPAVESPTSSVQSTGAQSNETATSE